MTRIARALLVAALLLFPLACDDSTGVIRQDTYELVRGPSGSYRGGTLILAYTSASRGNVWYQIDRPATADRGTFRLRGSDDIDIYLRSAHRTGDFDDRGRRLDLNDGTRWERVR